MVNNKKIHYKMYKSGKHWIFSAITVSMVSAGIAGGSFLVNTKSACADTTTSSTIPNKTTDSDNMEISSQKIADISNNIDQNDKNQSVKSNKLGGESESSVTSKQDSVEQFPNQTEQRTNKDTQISNINSRPNSYDNSVNKITVIPTNNQNNNDGQDKIVKPVNTIKSDEDDVNQQGEETSKNTSSQNNNNQSYSTDSLDNVTNKMQEKSYQPEVLENSNNDQNVNNSVSIQKYGSNDLIAAKNNAAIQDGLNIKISDLNSDNPTYDNGGLMPFKVDTSITNPNVSINKGDNIRINVPDSNQIDWDNSYINGFSNPYGTAVLNKNNSCIVFTFSSDVSQSEYGFSFYADIKFINVTTELQGPFTLTASFNTVNGESNPLTVTNPTFYTKHIPYDPSVPSVPFQEPAADYQGPNQDNMANVNNTIGGYAGGVAYKYDNGFMTASNKLDPVNATLQYKNRTYIIDTEGGSSIDIDSFIFYLPNSNTPLTYMQLYEQTGILLKSNNEHNLTLYIPDGYNDTNIIYDFNIMGPDPTATGDPYYKRYIYGSNFVADGYNSAADGFNGPNRATWALNLFYQYASSSPRLVTPNKSADLNQPPFNAESENNWLLDGVTAERMADDQHISILDDSDFNNAWNNKKVGTYEVKYQITDSNGQPVDMVIGFVTITESQQITITYIDEQTGEEVKGYQPTIQFGMYGSSYTTSAPDISNYILDNSRMPNNAFGIVGSSPIMVTYYYKHATTEVSESKNQTAIINYVSQNGGIVTPTYTQDFVFTRTGTKDLVTGETSDWSDWTTPALNDPSTKVTNLEIVVKSPTVIGYTLKNQNDAFVTGVLNGSHGFAYTVVYIPKEYQVTINYVMGDGTKVNDEIINGNYNTVINTVTDIPAGYHYVSGLKKYTITDDPNQSINIIVAKNQQSINGRDVTIYTGQKIPTIGADYSATATDIDGKEIPVTVTIDDPYQQAEMAIKSGNYQVTLTAANGLSKVVTLHVLNDQAAVTGHDVTIYVSDSIPTSVSAYGATAISMNGKPVGIRSIDTSLVNNQQAGTYPVIIIAADGQMTKVNVIVLANKAKITAHDVTIHIGNIVPNSASSYGASAVGKDGKTPVAIKSVNTSKVNNQKVGDYPVIITDADGISTKVTVHVVANQASISGHDVTIYAGDAMPETSAFGAVATDENGNSIKVIVDTSKVNNEIAGTYPVTITAADGQTKQVNVIVLANEVPVIPITPVIPTKPIEPRPTPVTPNTLATPAQPVESSAPVIPDAKTSIPVQPADPAQKAKPAAIPAPHASTKNETSAVKPAESPKRVTLPQTGQDTTTSLMSIIGAILLSILGFFGIDKLRKKR